jgi:hypothetical protein
VRGYTLRQVRAFMGAIERREAARAGLELKAAAISTAVGLSGGKAVEALIKTVDRGGK